MALQGTFTLRNSFGLDADMECYVRVATVSGTKLTQLASVEYLDPIGRTAVYATRSHVFSPDLEGGNFIEQAYLHLKSLPEFAGADDVIEAA